jgi:hypothetical protein
MDEEAKEREAKRLEMLQRMEQQKQAREARQQKARPVRAGGAKLPENRLKITNALKFKCLVGASNEDALADALLVRIAHFIFLMRLFVFEFLHKI